MTSRKIILIMICITSLLTFHSDERDYEKYTKLKIKDVTSIKKSDLPQDFSDNAFKVVDDLYLIK